MPPITLDDATCQKLLAMSGGVEICDSTGRVVGDFMAGLLNYGKLPPGMVSPFTEEERREARKYQGPGRTLDEIFRSLNIELPEPERIVLEDATCQRLSTDAEICNAAGEVLGTFFFDDEPR